jgi:hypothetical protein
MAGDQKVKRARQDLRTHERGLGESSVVRNLSAGRSVGLIKSTRGATSTC